MLERRGFKLQSRYSPSETVNASRRESGAPFPHSDVLHLLLKAGLADDVILVVVHILEGHLHDRHLVL